MAFSYQVNLSDPSGETHRDAVLVADLQQALSQWSQYINGTGNLVAALNITNTSAGRESGGATSSFYEGNVGGKNVYGSSALYELTTGMHVAGTTSDVTINVDPAYEKQLDLARPLTATSSVPANKFDPVTLFMHELDHGFGQQGYLSQSGVPASPSYESSFDTYIQQTPDGHAYFTGPTAEAVYGGPVPLTTGTSTQNYYHFGDTLSDSHRSLRHVQDPLTLDLMNGIEFFYNHDYQISRLDVAVMADLGYSVNLPAATPPHR